MLVKNKEAGQFGSRAGGLPTESMEWRPHKSKMFQLQKTNTELSWAELSWGARRRMVTGLGRHPCVHSELLSVQGTRPLSLPPRGRPCRSVGTGPRLRGPRPRWGWGGYLDDGAYVPQHHLWSFVLWSPARVPCLHRGIGISEGEAQEPVF